LSDVTEPFERVPAFIRFHDRPKFAETYGFAGSQGLTVLEGQILRPRTPSRTIFLFMHPSSALHHLPMPAALASSGLHVLCAMSRYPRNDSSLIMEKVAVDMGAWVRWARESGGYEKVILVGWSGGGALSLFYQSQAERPTITHTAAGDEVDLTKAQLPKADGIIFIAAHLSRAETLTEWIDPSVMDEANPNHRDMRLDIYNPACPYKPPFDSAFVAEFRAAQLARSRRITQWCRDLLDEFRRNPDGEFERAFVVHRTMCDPRWIDPAVDPNDRKPNWCYLGDPRAANIAPAGLARYSSLRSWMSQWSIDLSNAKGPANAARIHHTPVLQIENSADDGVPATHNPAIHHALTTADKEYVIIAGATHYYVDQPEHLQRCLDAVRDWSERRGFITA
jgi:pimeloyl-ACP methyl ester carboxylesterase